MIRTCMAAVAALVLGASVFAAENFRDEIQVQVRGTLHFERGQPVVEVDNNILSLDFGRNDYLFRSARDLDRSQVQINGRLMLQRGQPIVLADRITSLEGTTSTSYPRYRYVEPRREVIVREERDQPIIKLPGLEIND